MNNPKFSSAVRLRLWSEEEFAASREPWQRLLGSSRADALFMSWDWQWLWWKHHREMLAAELVVVAAYDADDALVGVAAFYSHRVRHRGFLRARRLQLMGGAWRDDRPAFSEYLDFIIASHAEEAVLAALTEWFASNRTWDELLLPQVLPDSLAARFAREVLARYALVRAEDPLVAHQVQLPETFDAYVASLSSGTRRRVVNQRTKAGELRFVEAGIERVTEDLRTLRAFKMERWAAGPHTDAFLAFHEAFAAEMARRGLLRLTRLMLGEQTVSVLYDVRAGGTEYYLESGFDSAFAQGMSPGYLHLGFAIEQACKDRLTRFDLLAGTGRHREYKRDLCPDGATLFCYQVVRAPLLRTLYRAHGFLKQIKPGSRAGPCESCS